MVTPKKYREKEYNQLVQVLENVFDFDHWKFQQTFVFKDAIHAPYIIYDSEWCRIWFGWDYGEMHQSRTMSVFYGRLHAPDDGANIIVNGKKCKAWHHVNTAINFLYVEKIPNINAKPFFTSN